MTCVKCYREQQAKDREHRIVAQFLHGDFIYNGMSLCEGHFNRELQAL